MSVLLITGDDSLSRQIAPLVAGLDRQLEVRTALEPSVFADTAAADLAIVDASIPGFADARLELVSAARRPPVALVAPGADLERLLALYRAGVGYCAIRPFVGRELGSVLEALVCDHQRVVCLGGGTGLHNVLTALRSIAHVHPTAVVSTSDDGGSSGVLRDELGVLPPGDLRRSLLALSNAPALMRQLMSFRFSRGRGLAGHNLGNLLLAGLSEITGSATAGFRAMGELLDISGVVLPVSSELDCLVAEFEDGSVVRGEHRIDVPDGRPVSLRIRRLTHDPPVDANLEALSAILGADLVTIGPGDLYTSVLANLTVGGVAESLAATRAKVVYVCNLMTKPGETYGYTAADHLGAIVDHVGPVVDRIIVSRTALPATLVSRYLLEEQEPVAVDAERIRAVLPGVEVWEADVGSSALLVRHSLRELASLFADMLALD